MFETLSFSTVPIAEEAREEIDSILMQLPPVQHGRLKVFHLNIQLMLIKSIGLSQSKLYNINAIEEDTLKESVTCSTLLSNHVLICSNLI